MRVLITGHNGFIGKNLTSFLQSRDIDVIEFIGNVANEYDCISNFSLADIDAVIHLAAYGNDSSHDQQSLPGIHRTLTTNVIGTTTLIHNFLSSNARIFIYAGSSSEYGTHDSPLSIETSLNGKTPYAVSKASMSQLVAGLDGGDKFFRVLRLFSVYGEHEKQNRLIPTAFNAAMTGETMPLADGVHDFVHVSDVCNAFYQLLIRPEACPVISHAASGKQYSNQEVINLIEEITGKHINTYPVERMRSFDSHCWVSDKKDILIKPKLSLRDGLKEVWSKLKKS